jgi:hypothetical protein
MSLTIPVAVVLAYVRPDSQTLRISFAIFAFAAPWFTFMLAGPSLSARRQFRYTPTAHRPMTIGASDAGLEIHSAHADSKVAWSAYMAWGEYKKVFIILPQPRIYVPIPKRAFTAEQEREFRELLRRNIMPESARRAQ